MKDLGLLAELDKYLEGCPNPYRVWPKWMVRKSSRLLWKCREAILGLLADARLGRAARAYMEKTGPIPTVSGMDVYSFIVYTGRDNGLDAAINTFLEKNES